jgi:hypothetical protein
MGVEDLEAAHHKNDQRQRVYPMRCSRDPIVAVSKFFHKG